MSRDVDALCYYEDLCKKAEVVPVLQKGDIAKALNYKKFKHTNKNGCLIARVEDIDAALESYWSELYRHQELGVSKLNRTIARKKFMEREIFKFLYQKYSTNDLDIGEEVTKHVQAELGNLGDDEKEKLGNIGQEDVKKTIERLKGG